MPTYAFRCRTCDEPFEVVLPFSRSDEPATCPTCGGSNTTRVYSFSSRAQIPKLMAQVVAAEASGARRTSGPGESLLEADSEHSADGAANSD